MPPTRQDFLTMLLDLHKDDPTAYFVRSNLTAYFVRSNLTAKIGPEVYLRATTEDLAFLCFHILIQSILYKHACFCEFLYENDNMIRVTKGKIKDPITIHNSRRIYWESITYTEYSKTFFPYIPPMLKLYIFDEARLYKP